MANAKENSPVLAIDIGCGSNKREGFIGLDHIDMPGVDHVLDLETDRFPFDDNTIDKVFSAHCLEHLSNPGNIWSEISRVIKPGGCIEIWTPYPHHDDQWLNGHISGWSQSRWKHLSSQERIFYSKRFLNGGFWKWEEARFVISRETRQELGKLHIPLGFAVRHMINIVDEWGCFFTYGLNDPGEHAPKLTFSSDRQDHGSQTLINEESNNIFKFPWRR